MALIGITSLVLATAYALLTLIALWVWRTDDLMVSPQLPSVTVLKPLCGADPGLYDNLRSFCQQDYPRFQIVFGALDQADSALPIAQRILSEFPWLPIDVVINPQQHGSNRKTSNLINMLIRARHDVLIISDSDTRVGADYLHAVTTPLHDDNVGLVTCIYHGIPTQFICSRLGAMYVNERYIPSVLLARLFGHHAYASGQTLALRRETLDGIGGLQGIANHLADDYRLGEMIRGLGLRIALSHYVPTVEYHEPTFGLLTAHELRWMYTLRVLRPHSFRMMFLTFSVPLATLGIGLAAGEAFVSGAAWSLFAITMMAPVALHVSHRTRDERSVLEDLWLLPVRDLLICWVWLRTFFISGVTWRGNEFNVDSDGVMRKFS